MSKKFLPFILALGLGVLAWLLIEPYGPDQEHWDNPAYWRFAYPAICVGCAVLGFLFPRNASVYGFMAMSVQALPPILANLDAELVGTSILMLIALSIPPALTGLFGAWIKRRFSSDTY